MVDVDEVCRRSRPHRWFRLLQRLIVGMLFTLGVGLAIATPRGWLIALGPIAFGVVVLLLFRWRQRALRRDCARVVEQLDEVAKVSYVRVGGASPVGLFRLMTRGMMTRLSRWHRPQQPVTLGDAAFDAGWIVDADEAVARRVLDDDVRATLVALHRELGSMQVASLEATPRGLIVRWPGPLSPAFAARLRELVLTIRSRLAA